MFLQKNLLQHQRSPSFSPSRHSTRLEEAVKKMSIPEIKSHQKKNQNHNTRNFLIEYTKKIFKEETKNRHDVNYSLVQPSSSHIRASSRQKKRPSEVDLSKRESRTAAARLFRSKISKRSDITPLLQAQEELNKSRQTQNLHMHRKQNSPQKIGRYQDILREFSQQIKAQKKQLIKSHWLALTAKSNPPVRVNTTKNPQVQVTNISFMQQEEPLQSRMVINRDRRREINKRNSHVSYTSYGRRPHKNNSHVHHDDNFIEPW